MLTSTNKRLTIKRYAALTIASIATTTLLPLTTHTAHAAEVAPGAPMRLDPIVELPADAPNEAHQMYCSQGLPGTVTLEDGTTKNVLISVGHCIWGIENEEPDVSPTIYAATPQGNRPIGTRDKGFKTPNNPNPQNIHEALDPADWASIELNDNVRMTRLADSIDENGTPQQHPITLTGVRDYKDLNEGEISFDDLGQPICKQGQTSGHTCGTQLFRTSNGIWYLGQAEPGDSGGIVYDPQTGEALGLTSLKVLYIFTRATPADKAIEETYNIPDGQVNERFTLPASTEAHDPTRSMNQDREIVQNWQKDTLIKQLPTFPQAQQNAHNNARAAANTIGNTLQTSRARIGDSTHAILNNPTHTNQILKETIHNTLEDIHTSSSNIIDLGNNTADTFAGAIQRNILENS